MHKALNEAGMVICMEHVPLLKKQRQNNSLLNYLSLIFELLELLTAPFKLFPIMHNDTEGDKNPPEII